MTGITHPEGCLCDGCVRAREEARVEEVAPLAWPVMREQPSIGCPNGPGPCWCTGACLKPQSYGITYTGASQ